VVKDKEAADEWRKRSSRGRIEKIIQKEKNVWYFDD
jgi:hypothetical protein